MIRTSSSGAGTGTTSSSTMPTMPIGTVELGRACSSWCGPFTDAGREVFIRQCAIRCMPRAAPRALSDITKASTPGDRRVEVDRDLLAQLAGGCAGPGSAGCPGPSARPLASASSRMRAAMWPEPLATTRGADLPGSYLSATAKWVGLTSTTSASAIAAIMRLRLIASWRARRWDLISGSPSLLLFSSWTSFLVIRVFLRLRRITTKKSAAASTSAGRHGRTGPARRCRRRRGQHAPETGSPPAVSSTGISPWTTHESTSPTTAVFSSALTPSQSACVPKTRFRPLSRLNCSKLPA